MARLSTEGVSVPVERVHRIDEHHLAILLGAMAQDLAGWPEVIVALAASGHLVGLPLARRLGYTGGLPVLDVVKDEYGARRLGGVVTLNPEVIRGKRVLGVDDTTVTGKLFADLTMEITRLGGEPRMAALVGVGNYPKIPGMVVGASMQELPTFPWSGFWKALRET